MSSTTVKVPLIKLKGSNEEIGYEHGRQLKERIHACFEFYTQKLILNPGINLREYGLHFLAAVRDHFPHYAVEMEALAEGACMEPWQIGLLNARTEVFVKTMDHPVNECTSCYFRDQKLFGENWDWMIECESLIVLMEIERPDGHKILMVAEPGILGKIGLNSKGLGVGLNILHGDEFGVGVPIHILLRAALDSETIEQAHDVVSQAPFCTFSNILMGDDRGNYLNLEYAGRKVSRVNYGHNNPIHTNHYLSEQREELDNPMYQNSMIRINRAQDLEEQIPGSSIQKMKQILLDKANGDEAICAEFIHRHHYQVGTVSSMIMDLPNRAMWVTRGNPRRHEFQEFRL